jgi:hypothetical protein
MLWNRREVLIEEELQALVVGLHDERASP